jgi:hypothetical protein
MMNGFLDSIHSLESIPLPNHIRFLTHPETPADLQQFCSHAVTF